ncbi:MAG: hypothetical protein AAF700_10875 [Pseudomonadota bacterium]
MTKLTPAELDFALRTLIENPEKLDEVKEQIQAGPKDTFKTARPSEARSDDFEDMFDNMPV